jgi:uncharacterized ion transporter superfamily protein YfcC
VRGLYATVDVAGFLFCIGGFLAVVNVSGAIDSGIARVVARLRGREIWMIPILMTLFSLGGTSWGACPNPGRGAERKSRSRETALSKTDLVDS